MAKISIVPSALAAIALGILVYALTLENHDAAAKVGAFSGKGVAISGVGHERPLPAHLTNRWEREYPQLGVAADATIEVVTVDHKVPQTVLGRSVLIRLSANQTVSIRGWAIDAVSTMPAGGVLVQIDGNVPIVASYGIPRPDVAASFQNAALLDSGYNAIFTPGLMKPGLHDIHICVLNAQRTGYYLLPDTPTKVQLFVP